MAERIDWIDYAKGIGIILVVYAHLLSSGYNAGLAIPAHFFQLSDSLVYSFHMPLFFFLAGLLVEESIRKRGVKKFLLSKVKLIAYPYLIWSFLQAGAEYIFAQHSNRGMRLEDVLSIPYLPIAQFWFLYALLWMYMMYSIFSLLGKMAPGVMLLCGGLLLFFPLKTNIMALGGFSTGFIFFATGLAMAEYGGRGDRFLLPIWVTVSLSIIFLGAGLYIFENLIQPVRLPGGSHPLYYVFLAFLGIGFSIGFAGFFASKKLFTPIKILGVFSLEIFLVHMLAGVGTRVVLQKVLGGDGPVIHMIAGVAAGLVVPILVYKASQKMNFPYLFNPGRLAAREVEFFGAPS